MRVLKKILIGIAILLAIILLVAVFLPKSSYTEKSIEINTSAELIFSQVNTLRNWEKWSPYDDEDTTMISTYEGNYLGIGSIMKWESSYGPGMLTIVESVPYQKIETKLDFYEKGKGYGKWQFEKLEPAIKVTWRFGMDDLKYPFERYMGLLLDNLMEPYFTKGLANLKNLTEGIHENFSYSDVVEFTTEAQFVMFIRDSVTIDEMKGKLEELFGEIGILFKERNIKPTGSPFTIYHKWDPNGEIIIEAGIPLFQKITTTGRVKSRSMNPMNVLTTTHYGSYEFLEYTYYYILKHIKENNIEVVGAAWEVYKTDPTIEKDTSKWVTEIYFPVKE